VFAPSAWNQVRDQAHRAGYSIDELRAAGLVQKSEKDGSMYDRFRARIIFPVRDPRARVVGFGARGMAADSKPKYLNSPEGDLYRKSETLYGIDIARGPIAKAGRAIVVEGYTDVLALHQAGIREAVAVMGTAITPEQLKILGSLAKTIVLALDADRAGTDAMIRAQRVAGDRGLELRVAAMPEGVDPAEMAQAGELERFSELVEKAIDLPTFRVRTVLSRSDLSSGTGREAALAELAPVLSVMGEVVGRDDLIREVADRLDTDPSLVSARVNSAPPEPPSRADATQREQGEPVVPEPAALTPRELKERALFEMAIARPEEGARVLGRLTDDHLSESGRRVAAWLREHLSSPTEGLPHEDQDFASLIARLVMASEDQPYSEGAMELNFMLLERQRLEDGISAAREAGDHEESARLSRERAELAERITHADAGLRGA
ncbi:MAG: DNA primase, partial [bacterium]